MALQNYERANLRKCLLHTLQEDGHNIEIVKLNISATAKKKVKEKNAENNEEEARGNYLAEKFEDKKELDKYSQDPPNKAIRQRVERTLISKALPGIDEDQNVWTEKFVLDYWVDGNKSKIFEHEQFFFLNHPEVAHKRHEKDMYYIATKRDVYLNSMIGYKPLRVEAMRQLNIMQFINLEREWCKSDPEVITLYETIKNSKDVQRNLNYQGHKEQANGKHLMSTLSDILSWIGIKFKKPCQKLNGNSERTRYYQIDDKHFNSKERLAILKSLEIKHSEWLSNRSQIDWVSNEKHSQILADKFKTVTSYEQFVRLKNEWYSQKKDENVYANDKHNKKINDIVQGAKALLSFEEEIRILSLKPIESLATLIANIEAQIVKKKHAALIAKIKPPTQSSTHIEYSLEFFRAQNINTRWGMLLEEAIEFGIPNAITVFNAAQKELGTVINKIVSYLPDKVKPIYQERIVPAAEPIEPQSVVIRNGKTYQDINHRLVLVNEKQPLPEITSENVVELAANCESVEEALKIVKAGDSFNKVGECLHFIGDRFRRLLLETGKYLHREMEKCYRSCYQSFLDGVPMMDEFA